ncbi:hypothetical protein [Clostridium transplantifaecale]|uniref:hypothetical protein n=1 Tax=Clostridium transplantifaecale TaxID=2479838 RepID=UPI000F63A1E6|nr:hypothetical protein [Clostridium transplantifaecale]
MMMTNTYNGLITSCIITPESHTIMVSFNVARNDTDISITLIYEGGKAYKRLLADFNSLPIFKSDGSADLVSIVGLQVRLQLIVHNEKVQLTNIALDLDYYTPYQETEDLIA